LEGGSPSLPPPPSIAIHTQLLASHVWYIKLPKYLFFLYGANDFEVGYMYYTGYWKGWALEIDVAHIKIILSRPI
jgi:hypothetical protein